MGSAAKSEMQLQSSYFVLNVWEEKVGAGHIEWRGELLHVDSGLTRRFEDWPELVEFIATALAGGGHLMVGQMPQASGPQIRGGHYD